MSAKVVECVWCAGLVGTEQLCECVLSADKRSYYGQVRLKFTNHVTNTISYTNDVWTFQQPDFKGVTYILDNQKFYVTKQ